VGIDTPCFQPLCKPASVHLGGDNKGGLGCFEGGAYEPGERIEQKTVTGVELNRVRGAI
jgi:hypothetical protein